MGNVAKNEQQAHGNQDLAEIVALQLIEKKALADPAERGADGRAAGDSQSQPAASVIYTERDMRPEQKKGAVRKIDDLEHAEDHRKPGGK